CLQGCRPPYSF
nr:immunoglobulin light chain junction region [Macaca mulatta]